MDQIEQLRAALMIAVQCMYAGRNAGARIADTHFETCQKALADTEPLDVAELRDTLIEADRLLCHEGYTVAHPTVVRIAEAISKLKGE